MISDFVTGWVNRYNETKFWRMYFSCQNGEVKGVKRIIYIYRLKRITSLHCCDLMITLNGKRNFGAYFSSKPFLPHGLNGIVIAASAKIGDNAVIHQQVTIGLKNENGGAPCIGNNVVIGAGAKILGGISIGNNVTIGANSVVISDVPDNCIVVGCPGKVKKGAGFKHDS